MRKISLIDISYIIIYNIFEPKQRDNPDAAALFCLYLHNEVTTWHTR